MTDTASAVPTQPTAGPEALSPQQLPRPKALSLRKNFGWALVGNVIYQGSQWLNLVILAKLTTAADVGRFALALAICTPVTTIAALNLRAVQVTDAKDEHRFGHFLSLQLLMSLLAVAVIAVLAAVTQENLQTASIVLVVGLGQAVVSIRDVFVSYNQKHERMDTVAVSKAMMGITSMAALGLGIWSTGSLLVGVIGLQAAKLAVFVTWDLSKTRHLAQMNACDGSPEPLHPRWNGRVMLGLAWLALPLGIAGVLLSLNTNIPRYLIAAQLGEEHLGYFAALVALAMAGTLVTQAAGMSALPRLSRYYISNRRAYLRLLGKLVTFGLMFGLAGLLIAMVGGRSLISAIFTPEYADYWNVFMWSMVYGACAYVITFLGYGMTSMRRFKVQPLANLSGLIMIVTTAWLLIPRFGLTGAVWSLIAGKLTQGFVTLLVILTGLRTSTPAPAAVPAGQDTAQEDA